MVQRWKMSPNQSMVTEPDGGYVEYTDHLAAMEEKDKDYGRIFLRQLDVIKEQDKEIERLKDTINGLINFIPDGWEMPLFWNQLVMQVKEDSDGV